MTIYKTALQIVRPRSLFMGAATVCAGMGAVGITAVSDILPFILCLLLAAFAQMWAHFAHCLADLSHEYGELLDDTYYHLSGVKRSDLKMICRGGNSAMMIVTLTLGMGMVMIAGWWAVAVGAFAFALGYLDNHGPYPLFRTPFSLMVTFLLFGVIGVSGTALVLEGYSEHVTLLPEQWVCVLLIGIAVGVTATNVQLYHEMGFRQDDHRYGKRTFPIRFGIVATVTVLLLNGIISAAILWYIPVYIYGHPHWQWMIPAYFVLATNIILVSLSLSRSEYNRKMVSVWTMYCQFIFCLLLMLCYIGHRI